MRQPPGDVGHLQCIEELNSVHSVARDSQGPLRITEIGYPAPFFPLGH